MDPLKIRLRVRAEKTCRPISILDLYGRRWALLAGWGWAWRPEWNRARGALRFRLDGFVVWRGENGPVRRPVTCCVACSAADLRSRSRVGEVSSWLDGFVSWRQGAVRFGDVLLYR